MRIALVTETYPPQVNGVAMTLGQLVEGLVARGHTVQLVSPRQHKTDVVDNASNPAALPVAGLPLPRYDGLRFGLPVGRTLRCAWQKQMPEVVHIATEGPLGHAALRTAQALNLPVTSSFHTNFHEYGQHYGYGFLKNGVTRYLRYFHNQTACTLVPSAGVQRQLTEAGFERVGILGRGVDANLFNPDQRDREMRRRWGADDDQLVVCYVGRVAEEKNVPLLVKAFKAIQQHRPDAKLVVVGDGPTREKLEQAYPEVIFAGMRKGQPLAAHYASADVFLFPSLTETYGNVTAEAMASGLAVVAFDYAAAKALIDTGENGLTVPFADEHAFIDAATQLACDSDKVKALGRAARQRAAACSWQTIVAQFEGCLQRAKDGAPALEGE
jgi:glycosyltransferase involved in cell wall biosynthesis